MIDDVLISEIRSAYLLKRDLIEYRLMEFKEVFDGGDDKRLFEELVFCILTSAVGPKMALKSVNSIKLLLLEGSEEEIYEKLRGVHKYPQRAYYIVKTRSYLEDVFSLELKELIISFKDTLERRDFFASNKGIKGIGYLQSSHFLRNVGFRGYAILDKNILKSLFEFGIVDNLKPPTTGKKYLEIENKMRDFAENKVGICIDELDMVLWSLKTGYVPR